MSTLNKVNELLEQKFLKEGGMKYILLAVFFLATTLLVSGCQTMKGLKDDVVGGTKRTWASLKKADEEFAEKYW